MFDAALDPHLDSQRSSILTSVAVLARDNLSLASTPRVVTRYRLAYQPDPITSKPRLASVTRHGENDQGAQPVALYYYGALATVTDAGLTGLAWSSPTAVPRSPALPPEYVDDIGDSVKSSSSDDESRTRAVKLHHTIRDFTGDGVPDELWKEGDTWHLARGLVTRAGPRLDGPESTWTQPAEIDWQNTFRYTDVASDVDHLHHGIATEVWTQFVDWNGDARLDVIETRAGSSHRMWKVWINRDDGSGGVLWRPTEVDVGLVREFLHDKGMRGYDAPTPTARRISWPRNSSWDCNYHECRCQNNECLDDSPAPGTCTGSRVADVCPGRDDFRHVLGSDTWTEWEVADHNQDGYPDIVSESVAIGVCVDRVIFPASVPDDTSSLLPNDPCPQGARCGSQIVTDRSERLDFLPCSAESGQPTPRSHPVAFLNRLGAFDDPQSLSRWTDPLVASGVFALNRWGQATLPNQPTGQVRQTHRLADDFGVGALSTSTDVTTSLVSDWHETCGPGAIGNGDELDPRTYHERHVNGAVDINADGLPDLLSGEALYWNTGVSVATGPVPVPIRAPSLSVASGTCGEKARNTSALTDLDADGFPDHLEIVNGALQVRTLRSTQGPVLAAGRLTAIANGFGALTTIRYGNAKVDGVSRHAVPFPEIVVDRVKTEITDDSGPSTAATYYRFGEARYEYDGASTRWANVRGVLTASEFDTSATAGAPFAERAERGHLKSTSRSEGDFDPSNLDPYLAPNGVTPFAAASFTYGSLQRPLGSLSTLVGEFFYDCADEASGAPAWSTWGTCLENGFYYQSSTRAWEGAPLPSGDNLYAGSTVTAVDEWGRVRAARADGDLRRDDDDTCTTVTYGDGQPFPSVVTSMVLTDCGAKSGTPRTLAATRYLYDGLPFGQVSIGRLSSRWVDRYDAAGNLLGTYQTGAYLYDAFGEVSAVISTRSLGGAATRTASITRDPFGATVVQVSEAASDVATTVVQTAATSTWPSLGATTTDAAGVKRREEYDSFGRPVRSTVTVAGQRWTLARALYDDSPTGRRVISEVYPGSTPTGSEASASDVQRSTTLLDAMGRVRFTQDELGGSYEGRTVVSDFVERDSLGRVVFIASPFEATGAFVPDAVARHGITYVYDVRGRLERTVEATGKNLAATSSDPTAGVYVSATTYTYGAGTMTVTGQGPDERDPASSRFGWVDRVTQTALGRELQRVRVDQAGVVQDKVEQAWDALGRVTETRRLQTPQQATATPAVVWTSEYDSFGNVLRATEPGVSRTSAYDEFGSELETSWMDGTTRRFARTSYDGFGRVVERTVASTPAGAATVIEAKTRYHYDAHAGASAQPATSAAILLGRLSWVEDAEGNSVYYGYDELGRRDAEVYLYRDIMGIVTQSSESTIGGRLATLRLTTDATDDLISYEYDSAGRTRVVASAGAMLFKASDVSPLGQYRAVAFGNEVTETYDFAPNGRRELLHWGASTASGKYTFGSQSRDAAGRIVAEVHTAPGSMTQWNTSYDGLGRLMTQVETAGLVPKIEMFTYDGLGNVNSRTTAIGTTFQYTPASGDPDRLCRYAAPGSGTACQFTYDGAGNVIEDRSASDVRRFTYDAGQRITEIVRGATKVALTYGPVGRMKTEVGGPNERTVWHFGELVERRLRSDGVTQIERSIPGPLGTFVSLRSELDRDGSVANEEQIYRHGDGRANRVFTRADGKVVQTPRYGVFGAVTSGGSDGSLTGSGDLWNGGDDLPEVGVVLLGPRAYDPVLGRFLQRDPIAILARSTTANPYAFAFSDPVNFSDPTGLSGECAAQCQSAIATMAGMFGGAAVDYFLGGANEGHGGGRPQPSGVGFGAETLNPGTPGIDYLVPRDSSIVSGWDPPPWFQDYLEARGTGEYQGTSEFLGQVRSVPGCIGIGNACSVKALYGSAASQVDTIGRLRECGGFYGCLEVFEAIGTREGLAMAAAEGVARGIAAAGNMRGLIGAGRGRGGRTAPFNSARPGVPNCVGSVCAFFKSVQQKSLMRAAEFVKMNGGSIARANKMIAEEVGARIGEPQVNVLKTARTRQFYIVYPGRSVTQANHVMVGIVNKGRTFFYDPQSGARIAPEAMEPFVAFPVLF